MTDEQKEVLEEAQRAKTIQAIFDRVRVKELKQVQKIKIDGQSPKRRIMYQVKLPAEGGILAYWDGIEHPSKGFPVQEAVERIEQVKRTFITWFSGFREMFSKAPVQSIIFLLLFKKQWSVSFKMIIQSTYRQLKAYKLQPDRYCDCVREIRRVFEELGQGTPEREWILTFQHIISTILEFDDSYRYRFQNIIQDLDPASYKKNPIRELLRLLKKGELRER